jgi:hypothetical protein
VKTYTVEARIHESWEVVSVFEPASPTKACERETWKAACQWAADHFEQGDDVRLWIEHDYSDADANVVAIGPGYSRKV